MASLTDADDMEESVHDDDTNKKIQSRNLKSGRLLGKGSSSIVYETTWKGKSYARKDFLRVPSDIFEREATVLVGLDHPNLVRTYCWTVDEGSCSLLVDLMNDNLLNLMRKRKASERKQYPGSGPSDASQTSHLIDLHKFIEDGKKAPASTASKSTFVYCFSMPEALHIMLEIAEGIVFLHDNGVAHGDLKPKNILVIPNEKAISGSLDLNVAFKLKVADFGLIGTKIKSKTLVSRQARRLEMVRWRAPELLDMIPLREGDHESFTDSSDWDSDSSDGKIGGRIHKFSYGKLARADVYSFALTCSQILTGEDPYLGLGLNDLARRIPLGLRPGLPRRCPAQLRDLINRCWGEELKRPTFIGILIELKELQASLTADSWVDIRKTTITGPDFELTISLKYVSEKFMKEKSRQKLLRDSEINEKDADLPIGPAKHSIKDNQESSKLTFVPKKRRRRRKVYGCLGSLGCMPGKTISSKENEDIPTPTKRNAKDAKNKKSALGKATSKPFSPNDKRYNAEKGRTIGAKPFTPAEVTAMTRNFKTKIGKGGFGTVYYGKLPDGQEVAVKVGDASSHQGYEEFFNEIDVLSRVRHKNLVVLVGYCQKKKPHILIYEYMNNGSLRDYLSGNAQNAGMLDWKRRLRIALDVALGLEYLHIGCEQRFVHGDVKSSNILLSADYDAKLTDFGLAKLMDGADTTKVTTFVRGTAGYIDPEYFNTQRLSTKSDIFAFGVVLLELITGRQPIKVPASSSRNEHLCDWVRAGLEKGNIDMVLDPALKSSVPVPKQEALWKVADTAMRCVEPRSIHRPTVSEVIQELRQAMVLEEPSGEPISSIPPSSITVTEIINLSPSRVHWSSSEYSMKSQLRENPIWGSPSINSAKETFMPKKRRRRRASSCLERLGCIPETSASMGKENKDISTSTFIIFPRSSRLRRSAEKSRAKIAQKIGRYIAAESFTIAEVKDMTRNFKTEIGKGGFGTVYYGKLPDGQEVAVKVGDASGHQGYEEFVNEIDVLSRVRHKNLVALVGYCEEDKQMILIYEYMNNGSLRDHLSGNLQNAGMLDWMTRLRIAVNAAQGLEYLHTGCNTNVIHRDVKSSNIVLSAKYDAKWTDFGLSKLMGEADDSMTHVSTLVKGTAGYLDPEYYSTCRLSTKSDIFSFGVVLLELITGRQPLHIPASSSRNVNLCDWVREGLAEGNIDMVVDPALKSSVPVPNREALWIVAETAMRCVEPRGIHRPTVSEVIRKLRQAIALEEPSGAPLKASLEDSDGSEIGPGSSPEMVR